MMSSNKGPWFYLDSSAKPPLRCRLFGHRFDELVSHLHPGFVSCCARCFIPQDWVK